MAHAYFWAGKFNNFKQSTKGMKIFKKWRSVFFGRKINIVQKTWNVALKLKAFVFRNLASWVILYL